MPKLDAKAVQKELEQGLAAPVYWLYGPEKMKSRELLKKIRSAVLGNGQKVSFLGGSEEVFEGDQVRAIEIVEAAKSLSFGGGTRLLVIREAHALKEMESLAELLGPSQPLSELPSICVFLAKDLDGQKSFPNFS